MNVIRTKARLTPTKKHFLLCALLVGTGVLLASVFHRLGWEHRLLTMQIPVLIGCFLLPMHWAAICATLVPVLCCVIAGTPALYPALPVMISQMIAMAAGGNMVFVVMKKNVYLSLLCAILAGWLLMFCAISILSWILDDIDAFTYALFVIGDGLPGTALQILFVPPVILLIHRRSGRTK